MVARRAHNPEAVGSNPAPATKNNEKPFEISTFQRVFSCTLSVGKCAILSDFMGDFCAKVVKKL